MPDSSRNSKTIQEFQVAVQKEIYYEQILFNLQLPLVGSATVLSTHMSKSQKYFEIHLAMKYELSHIVQFD